MHLLFLNQATGIWLFPRCSAVQLDLNLFVKACIVLTKNGKHFFPAEMIRNRSSFGKAFSQCGSAQKNAVCLAVGQVLRDAMPSHLWQ